MIIAEVRLNTQLRELSIDECALVSGGNASEGGHGVGSGGRNGTDDTALDRSGTGTMGSGGREGGGMSTGGG